MGGNRFKFQQGIPSAARNAVLPDIFEFYDKGIQKILKKHNDAGIPVTALIGAFAFLCRFRDTSDGANFRSRLAGVNAVAETMTTRRAEAFSTLYRKHPKFVSEVLCEHEKYKGTAVKKRSPRRLILEAFHRHKSHTGEKAASLWSAVAADVRDASGKSTTDEAVRKEFQRATLRHGVIDQSWFARLAKEKEDKKSA